MKPKSHRLLLLLLFTLLILPACNAAGEADQVVSVADQLDAAPVQTDAETDVADTAVSACPEPTAGAHLLVDAAHGICFLYPDHYDLFQGEESGFTLYVRSLLNTEAPLASFSFEPADGRSLDAVTAQRLTDVAFPDTEAQPITLGGEPAVTLDNLPGQDTNRRVVATHEGNVMDMIVARIGADYGEVGSQAEALYDMITGSLQFIPVVTDAPLRAGPECPQAVAGTTMFTNIDDGFCLLLPDGYAMAGSSSAESAKVETTFYVDSLQDVSHARLIITVEDASGRSLSEITTAYETEIETALPGYDVMWSFGYMLDGQPANQFDQVPGQDLSRQVLTVHDGRLYTLTFIPDDPAAGDAYTEMQAVYDMVMDSFSFLWQE